MKKTVINLLVIIGIICVTFFSTRAYFPKTIDNTVTDTVRVDVPYEVTKIKEVEKPITVTEYKTEYDTVETVRVEKDTVYINNFAYNARFLTQYPTAPRFLGLQFANHELNLTYQTINGNTRGKTWQVGSKGYTIGLDGGEPNINTFNQPEDPFSHYIEVGRLESFNYGSFYLQYSAEYNILGIDIKAEANVNRNPYGKIGVKHEL